MTLYIVPPLDPAESELRTIASRAGVSLIEPASLYELWPHITGGQIVVAAIDATNFAILNRHMSTLLPELPVVVLSAPGASYRSDWNMIAHALPTEDWITLEAKLLKSGLLASSTGDAEKRVGIERLEPDTFASAASRMAGKVVKPADDQFDPDEVVA